MRGYYRALPLKEQAVEQALKELALRERFFADEADFARHFSFAPAQDGWVEIGVATELGENLLAFAKMQGLARFRKAPPKEE